MTCLLDNAEAGIKPRSQGQPEAVLSLTKTGQRDSQTPRKPEAQVAELVDALASGASALMGVEVRVFSWAP